MQACLHSIECVFYAETKYYNRNLNFEIFLTKKKDKLTCCLPGSSALDILLERNKEISSKWDNSKDMTLT